RVLIPRPRSKARFKPTAGLLNGATASTTFTITTPQRTKYWASRLDREELFSAVRGDTKSTSTQAMLSFFQPGPALAGSSPHPISLSSAHILLHSRGTSAEALHLRPSASGCAHCRSRSLIRSQALLDHSRSCGVPSRRETTNDTNPVERYPVHLCL